ncbi:RNA polymerase-associated protein RapA [Marinimicrobium sp. ABcell2]|uniref:RNA polymerase-associated protein RapA n=1 Tax=Marinimicrobium sp. ABcell2 TaxID=3069751 RepID=UPI0027B08356|nr:RNA polymerase-associated protein RapA [Marinimicrobium sp. ABcell2]MDQ2075495.1 RNA polymerase-associated protein RapA [Marinimicrobium sp. ABcell2]
MKQQQFVTGQRWVSDTEAELGLGIVLEVENRRLTLGFPASGERRTYALDNAPVSRVRYQPDEHIRHQNGTRITVTEVLEQGQLLAYRGVTKEGTEELIPEFELDSFVQFSTPRERLFSGQIDKYTHFALRHQTQEAIHRHQHSVAYGLAGPRVQLLPHQLYIAKEVANRHSPRVLLADEVGLGKTIEAGLILHQRLISGQAHRVLVVVPDSLQHQWLVEMLRRFNLNFTLLDEERCQAMNDLDDIDPSLLPEDEEIIIDESDDNPFETAQLIICALDFLTDNPKRYQQALEAEWDMLLVDEAHHLEWSEEAPSPGYSCIEGLAGVAKSLLLLTATPEQLGVESHFARLRLLDPHRYRDLAQFIAEEENYQSLNDVVQDLLKVRDASESPSKSHWQALGDYLPQDTLSQLQKQAEQSPAAAIDQIIELLLDRHGTGRVLFRNTRSSVSGFPERKLHTYPLNLDDEDLLALVSEPLEQQLRPEDFWQQQTDADWWMQDARVEWLSEWLRSRRAQKILVICASADTAQSLELYLRLRKGLPVTAFHEGMNLIARDRAAAYFADHEDGAQVLICSEIGSEGRNFQFAQDLVLFDLPLNPDLLEQRIGRLDRIGQTGEVNLHVPFYALTAQERLLDWYHEGLNAFEQTCAIGYSVFNRYADRLQTALVDAEEETFAQLLDETRVCAKELTAQLQAGRDRLLELNSCKPERAAQLVDALEALDNDPKLNDYLDQVADSFNIEQEQHGEFSSVLHPGEHMRVPHFPGLAPEGMTVTTSRSEALGREDIQFLTWEHPLIRGAQELVAHSEFGNTGVCTLKLPPLNPGTLLLEVLFVLHCPAPAALQVPRFLPESVLHLLLDPNGKDLSPVLSAGKLNALLQKVPRPSAQELVRHARPQLSAMLDQAESLVQPRREELVEAARERMRQELNAELDRLRALAKVNPNVRQSEIDSLQNRLETTETVLDKAQLRLDAVRVIMTV